MKARRWKNSKIKAILAALFILPVAAVCNSQAIPTTQPVQLSPTRQVLRPRVIVFVHGLHGSRESWRAPNGAYWPEMVRTDPRFAFSDVEVVDYPTPASNGKMTSVQLAEILWERLQQDHVWEHREVVFVAHSLGGILVEEMVLRHPADAAKVRFIVSYGTPHEGSSIARMASIYDKDPLLGELSDTDNNTFLTQLESDWRGHDSVNGIHRFCAYEAEDTMPESRFGRYLRAHARVVSYFSATYGCDVTTPPQEIKADHGNMIRPLDRQSAAYDFFYRVYRDNPVLEEQFVTRETVVPGLQADCDQINANTDFLVRMALDSALHEKVVSAVASLVDAKELREVNPNPPAVVKIDPDGAVHVRYGFRGPSKKLFVCLGAARASLKVEFRISQQVAVRELGN
jgi:pimeloyl-ACP methyl ester carboxylesterase